MHNHENNINQKQRYPRLLNEVGKDKCVCCAYGLVGTSVHLCFGREIYLGITKSLGGSDRVFSINA